MLIGTFTDNWRNKQKGDRIVISHESCVLEDEVVKRLVGAKLLHVEEVKEPKAKSAKGSSKEA